MNKDVNAVLIVAALLTAIIVVLLVGGEPQANVMVFAGLLAERDV